MKRLFVILLLGCITGQAFVRTAWTLHYQWNRAMYLKNCENRDKPNLRCHGKCQLKKRMALRENNSPTAPQLPEGFRQIKDISLYFESFEPFSDVRCTVVRTEGFPLFAPAYPEATPLAGIFKPPAA